MVHPTTNYGPWIETFTGKKFHFQFPDPDEICIEDIAHALARICRYTGHVRAEHYSVAQHSVLVSHLKGTRVTQLAGLLHDAQEAYLGDLNSPLKSLLADYQIIEGNVQWALILKYGLTGADWKAIDAADTKVGYAEGRAFMANVGKWAGEGPFFIDPLPPMKAEALFLSRWGELTKCPK